MTNEFTTSYFNSVVELYRLTMGKEPTEEIKNKIINLVNSSIENTKEDNTVVIHNNFNHTVVEKQLVDVISDIYGKRFILSAYGTLFERHSNKLSPLIAFLIYMQDRRKKEKGLKFEHINDADKSLFILHDILQLLCKLVGNAEYGAGSEKNYILGNPFIGPSTTYNGYAIITSGVMFLESLMENNINFENNNDVIRFIEECVLMTRKYPDSISDILDNPDRITNEMLLDYLCDFKCYEGCTIDRSVIAEVTKNFTQEFRNRVYYANNMKELFFNSKIMTDLLAKSYDEELIDPNKPTEKIKDSIKALNEYIRKFVAHPYIKYNRADFVKRLHRKNVLLVDSDSLFSHLGRFIEGIFDVLVPMDHKVQESQNHKIAVTLLGNCIIAGMLQDILDAVTGGLAVSEEYQPRINMKSEFLFERIVMTPNKKNYATKVIVQEGNRIEHPDIDIKGLPIKKVSTNKLTRKYFTDVLADEYFNKAEISPKLILRKFLDFENIVYDSLTNKRSTEFLVPGKFTSFAAYKKVESAAVPKAVTVWNALRPKEAIPTYTKVNILPIKEISSPEDIEHIKDKYPEDYAALCKMFKDSPQFFAHSGAKSIAIPKKIKTIPKVLVELMDINAVVKNNVQANYPLMESVGFKTLPYGNTKVFSSFISL